MKGILLAAMNVVLILFTVLVHKGSIPKFV